MLEKLFMKYLFWLSSVIEHVLEIPILLKQLSDPEKYNIVADKFI